MGLIRVKMCQDGGLGEGSLEVSNASVWSGAPSEQGVLVGEVNQGNDDVGEPNNESVIEVGNPKNAWTALRLVRVGQDADCVGFGCGP